MVSVMENGGIVIEADTDRCPFRKDIKCTAGEVCTACGIYKESERIFKRLQELNPALATN